MSQGSQQNGIQTTGKRGCASLFVREERLRSGWRVSLYLALYGFGLVLVQVPIFGLYALLLFSRGLRTLPELLPALLPTQLPVGIYLAVKVAELAMLVPLTYTLRRFVDRRTWPSLGFTRDPAWGWDILVGLGLGATPLLLILGIGWASGWLSVGWSDRTPLAMAGQSAAAILLFALAACGEELVFRGYLQANFSEGMSFVPSLLLASALFGLFHGLNPNANWLALLNIALAGLSMGYGKFVTGSLWLPIAYHWAWNTVQGPLLGLPVSGLGFAGLLGVVDRGRAPLFTGGAFGPEGGLLATLLLLASFPLLHLWGRKGHAVLADTKPIEKGPQL